MQKRLLAVFAHPDDESFGPGGTLAKYSQEGVEVQILCATKGEAGRISSLSLRGAKRRSNLNKDEIATARRTSGLAMTDVGYARGKELLEAAKVLGVKKVEFLNFRDGELSNNKYHDLAKKISQKIKEFKPQVVLTFDQRGVSGHLDHIAVCLTTTFAFRKQNIAQRLFYYARPNYGLYKSVIEDFFQKRYFIYFPDGYSKEEITTVIDVSKVWDIKVGAMKKHESQAHDVRRILLRYLLLPKKEHFIMWGDKKKAPKEDLFKGL